MATVEPTPELFKWNLEKIARARRRDIGAFRHDCWIDGQVWNNRKRFEGGLCDFVGNWPAKSLELASCYARARQLASFDALTGQPMMYAVWVDLHSQAALLRDMLLPYLFHYRNSRNPPAILLAGKYFGAARAQDPSILEIREDGSSPSGVTVGFSPAVSGFLRASSPSASASATDLGPSAPYLMFSAELTMAPLL